jgi:hypothetical protein
MGDLHQIPVRVLAEKGIKAFVALAGSLDDFLPLVFNSLTVSSKFSTSRAMWDMDLGTGASCSGPGRSICPFRGIVIPVEKYIRYGNRQDGSAVVDGQGGE